MYSQQISYRELASLAKEGETNPPFRAILTVLPDSGCRLFVSIEHRCVPVIDEHGQPKYFPSIEFALPELAMLPGIDHQVTVDVISLLPRALTGNRVFGGTGTIISRLLGNSRCAMNLVEPT